MGPWLRSDLCSGSLGRLARWFMPNLRDTYPTKCYSSNCRAHFKFDAGTWQQLELSSSELVRLLHPQAAN